jgi:hypothetical protein
MSPRGRLNHSLAMQERLVKGLATDAGQRSSAGAVPPLQACRASTAMRVDVESVYSD